MTVTTGSHAKELTPGLRASFDGMVNNPAADWKKYFRIVKSDKKYEEVMSNYAIGLADVKPEGDSITYDNFSQGIAIRHTHKTYAKGVIITKEALEDNLYEDLAQRGIRYLGKAHSTSEEYAHANILNYGFTVVNYHQEGGDGKVLFATDHTLRNGTYSNLLTASSLSRATLQDGIIQVRKIKDESGVHFSGLREKALVVPTELVFEAQIILKSMQEPENANNAINPVYNMLPVISSNYLTSSTAWFITTDAPEGLIHYDRTPYELEQTNDPDTKNLKITSSKRYSCGVIDTRGVFGNAGA